MFQVAIVGETQLQLRSDVELEPYQLSLKMRCRSSTGALVRLAKPRNFSALHELLRQFKERLYLAQRSQIAGSYFGKALRFVL